MRIAIISAMEEEIKFLLHQFTNSEIINRQGYKFYQTTYKNHQLIIVQGGIGKTAAGMLFATLVAHFHPDIVINTGICGGRYPFVTPGDIIVGQNLIYGDVDVVGFGYRYGQLPGCPLIFRSDIELVNICENVKKGDILTRDVFVTSGEESEALINKHFADHDIIAFDMESAAFAQAALMYNVPFLVIRVVSDVVGITSTEEYSNNEVTLPQISEKYILNLIEKIK